MRRGERERESKSECIFYTFEVETKLLKGEFFTFVASSLSLFLEEAEKHRIEVVKACAFRVKKDEERVKKKEREREKGSVCH